MGVATALTNFETRRIGAHSVGFEKHANSKIIKRSSRGRPDEVMTRDRAKLYYADRYARIGFIKACRCRTVDGGGGKLKKEELLMPGRLEAIT
jgi:hypothetical protein